VRFASLPIARDKIYLGLRDAAAPTVPLLKEAI